MPEKVMTYFEALRQWNVGGSSWCMPRKGTEDQKQVRAIMEQPKKRKLRKVVDEATLKTESGDETKTDKKEMEEPKKRKLRKVEEMPELESMDAPIRPENVRKQEEEKVDGTYVLQNKSTGDGFAGRAGKTDYNIYKLEKKEDDVYDFKLVYVLKPIKGDFKVYEGVPKRKIDIKNVKIFNITDLSAETTFYTDKGTFVIPKHNKTLLKFYERAMKYIEEHGEATSKTDETKTDKKDKMSVIQFVEEKPKFELVAGKVMKEYFKQKFPNMEKSDIAGQLRIITKHKKKLLKEGPSHGKYEGSMEAYEKALEKEYEDWKKGK